MIYSLKAFAWLARFRTALDFSSLKIPCVICSNDPALILFMGFFVVKGPKIKTNIVVFEYSLGNRLGNINFGLFGFVLGYRLVLDVSCGSKFDKI